ncbi:flagellar biosynthetic protein FliO [Intestinibacillus sp. Marseille-P6563]|uniref:flagellar biosynthetic protein FliO n=1 Tax=Intestinibacillus sp. Marseille-P6563 TaxID=2364792 RepID=UPI000F06A3C0|nr:flagellar biosynthetic protein FliO [Intestinibacillus sp. Marseille-P6563]
MKDWLSLIGMLLCVVVILYLAYWFTRRIAAGNNIRMRTGGRHMQVYDRLPLGQNKMLTVVRVGSRWFVLGISGEHITTIAELTEEEAHHWRTDSSGQGSVETLKFSDILDALHRKSKKP